MLLFKTYKNGAGEKNSRRRLKISSLDFFLRVISDKSVDGKTYDTNNLNNNINFLSTNDKVPQRISKDFGKFKQLPDTKERVA